MVEAHVFHAEELGSKSTLDKVPKCELFLRGREVKSWIPRMLFPLELKSSLLGTEKKKLAYFTESAVKRELYQRSPVSGLLGMIRRLLRRKFLEN